MLTEIQSRTRFDKALSLLQSKQINNAESDLPPTTRPMFELEFWFLKKIGFLPEFR